MASASELRRQQIQRGAERKEFDRKRRETERKYGVPTTTTLPKKRSSGSWVRGTKDPTYN